MCPVLVCTGLTGGGITSEGQRCTPPVSVAACIRKDCSMIDFMQDRLSGCMPMPFVYLGMLFFVGAGRDHIRPTAGPRKWPTGGCGGRQNTCISRAISFSDDNRSPCCRKCRPTDSYRDGAKGMERENWWLGGQQPFIYAACQRLMTIRCWAEEMWLFLCDWR